MHYKNKNYRKNIFKQKKKHYLYEKIMKNVITRPNSLNMQKKNV